ncbi:MAG: histidine kinase dimerization/phospho-acceptor domain-containing protein, partial [Bryobacteraceae bacterium]
MLRVAAPLVEVRWFLDRIWLAYFTAAYVLGALALSFQLHRAEDAIVRRQLKYLRNGAVAGIVPFTLFYVLPYLAGATPGYYQRLAVLSLVLIPITWAYAILRYRLMDVDVIFQQGYVYTLATLCVLGIFYGLIFSFTKPEELSPVAIVGLILFATFIFQPIREWIQEQLDRNFFYKDRYDSRRTLIEFARELSSETNLDDMLESLGDRLVRTLSIPRIAFFLADENEQRFQLRTTVGDDTRPNPAQTFDLSFLGQSPDAEKPYLFFERTRHPLDVLSGEWPPSVRRSIADLDLTYYFACSVRGRTIAYLGVSRTDKGDFLTSDDVELLTTLSGYVAIAVENARLYHSLQQKAEEYERLKEFSENIVESINVGILAADLEDRVESWNTQIEKLTGIPREAALGRRLGDLFPPGLQDQLDHVRGETGVHNVYKFVFSPAASPYARRNDASANGNVANGHGGNGVAVPLPPRDAILNIAVAPLVSKEFKQIGRLIIFDDVTDRDELERRLVQADKLSSIGLLAAGVAHEVNTPLAVISTYAQMLAKQISGQDQQSKLLEKIAKQTFRASEIVNSLLNFSRTSTTEYLEVQLNRIIQETLNLLEHQLQKSGVRVEVSLDERLPLVKGNSGKLQQVFLNLFLNARDAMESGGTLSVHSW